MKSHILAAIAATSLLAPIAALAAPAVQDAAPKVSVRYDDLNLNSAAGHAALMDRVRHAAQTLCGPADELDKLSNAMRVKACVDKTSADILSKIPAASTVAGSANHAG